MVPVPKAPVLRPLCTPAVLSPLCLASSYRVFAFAFAWPVAHGVVEPLGCYSFGHGWVHVFDEVVVEGGPWVGCASPFG
jgi:hypothetical protein